MLLVVCTRCKGLDDVGGRNQARMFLQRMVAPEEQVTVAADWERKKK